MLVPILLMEDLDMGQVSPFFRRSSVIIDRLTNALTETSRSVFKRGLGVSRRDLRTRLRRLRSKLRTLLRKRPLTAQTPVSSR
jgi:hypothetical protein